MHIFKYSNNIISLQAIKQGKPLIKKNKNKNARPSWNERGDIKKLQARFFPPVFSQDRLNSCIFHKVKKSDV